MFCTIWKHTWQGPTHEHRWPPPAVPSPRRLLGEVCKCSKNCNTCSNSRTPCRVVDFRLQQLQVIGVSWEKFASVRKTAIPAPTRGPLVGLLISVSSSSRSSASPEPSHRNQKLRRIPSNYLTKSMKSRFTSSEILSARDVRNLSERETINQLSCATSRLSEFCRLFYLQ